MPQVDPFNRRRMTLGSGGKKREMRSRDRPLAETGRDEGRRKRVALIADGRRKPTLIRRALHSKQPCRELPGPLELRREGIPGDWLLFGVSVHKGNSSAHAAAVLNTDTCAISSGNIFRGSKVTAAPGSKAKHVLRQTTTVRHLIYLTRLLSPRRGGHPAKQIDRCWCGARASSCLDPATVRGGASAGVWRTS